MTESTTHVTLWVVYKNPSDFPGSFVVRRQFASAEGVEVEKLPLLVTNNLESVRISLPQGLVRMERHEDDDPKIVEVWI